jgi:hypothetical protein
MANAGPGQVGDALLERGTQLAALAGMLAEVRASSSGRLVAVGGEAGVGKTALLQCFCRAEVRAGHALWGACAPLERRARSGRWSPLQTASEANSSKSSPLRAGRTRSSARSCGSCGAGH